MRWLECNPATQRQGWPDSDAIERHVQIGARKAVAVNIARDRSLSAKRRIDLGPVNVLRVGRCGKRHKGTAEQEWKKDTHRYLLLDGLLPGHAPPLIVAHRTQETASVYFS